MSYFFQDMIKLIISEIREEYNYIGHKFKNFFVTVDKIMYIVEEWYVLWIDVEVMHLI